MRLLRLRAFLIAATLPLLLGCFEDPIAETLTIEFQPEKRVALTVVVKIERHVAERNRLALARIERTVADLLSERDEWARRFRAVELERERFGWAKQFDKVASVERFGLTSERDLTRFFSDTAVNVIVTEGDGWKELTLYPGRSDRATREDRTQLDRQMTAWSTAFDAYSRQVSKLNAYVVSHPDRAQMIGIALFGSDEGQPEPEPTEDEAEILDAMEQTMTRVREVLAVPEQEQERSLNEIVRRVHDPFPAAIVVKVPGTILEHEGFEASKNSASIRPINLAEALNRLRGRWMAVDLLMSWTDSSESPTRPTFDRSSLGRPAQAPSSVEVRAAVEKLLQPRAVYRLRWKE